MAAHRSIDALPLELMRQIYSLLQKEDLLKLRLVAPRTLLPFINAILFENLIIDIDGTDDLPRWVEAEADGVAIKRLQEVATSRISDHVRVLTLRLTRPYSLSGYYEKLGVKTYPKGYRTSVAAASAATDPKPTLAERISSFFRPAPKEEAPKVVDEVPAPKPRKRVDYAVELATALQALFKATDLVRKVRLIQPEGFNSEYDIVYPSIYARVLVRLINALQDVKIPEDATLELLDCPITHLEEAGLTIDVDILEMVASQFSHLTLGIRPMGYAVIKPGTTNLKTRPYNGQKVTAVNSLGSQLLKGLSRNTVHIKSLNVICASREKTVLLPFIEPKNDWPFLLHLELRHFAADAQLFINFTSKVIVHLETMILTDGMLSSVGDDIGWRFIYDTWISIKRSKSPDQWSLKTLHLQSLVDSHNHFEVSHAHATAIIQALGPTPPRKKIPMLDAGWPGF